jgi:hypothetical protein
MDGRHSKARRGITLLLLAALFTGAASSASAGWVQSGIDWQAWPSARSAGDCFGNCGAGCSTSANVCGGPAQYWNLTFNAGPDWFQSGWEATPCVENQYYVRQWDEYHAIGLWSYHGWVMPGCISHDLYCNQWLIGCLLFFGCGSPGWTDTWSYQQWMRGYTVGRWEYGGEC